jgi:hypothetical protein
MHKIHAKEFTLDDFTYETLIGSSLKILNLTIDELNRLRDIFNNGGFDADTGEYVDPKNTDIWRRMIELLPSSYNQKRTIFMTYENLVGMYKYRKKHKLNEWRELCEWMKTLPYSELFTGEYETSREEF